jgi:hypothetical protein
MDLMLIGNEEKLIEEQLLPPHLKIYFLNHRIWIVKRFIEAFIKLETTKLKRPLTIKDIDAVNDLIEKDEELLKHSSDLAAEIIRNIANVYHVMTSSDPDPGVMQHLLPKDFNKRHTNLEKDIRDACIANCKILFSTCNSLLSFTGRNFNYEVLIVDEAVQVADTECMSLLIPQLRKVVLIGDPHQLNRFVSNENLMETGYGKSTYERIRKDAVNLSIQYRMHPSISSWPTKYIYQQSLIDSLQVKRYTQPWYSEEYYKPLMFISLKDSHELKNNKSYSNFNEATCLVFLLGQFVKKYLLHFLESELEVVILTPYIGQKEEIETQLQSVQGELKVAFKNVSVSSIDAFQGKEADIVFLSLTRSNSDEKIGFLKDLRRLNVALTRAKYSLWIIGNETPFTSETFWLDFINHCKDANRYIKFEEIYSAASQEEQLELTKPLVKHQIIDENANIHRMFNNEAFIWKISLSASAFQKIKNMGASEKNQLVEGIIKIICGSPKLFGVCPYPNETKKIGNEIITVGHLLKRYKLGNSLNIMWTVRPFFKDFQQGIFVIGIENDSDLYEVMKRFKKMLNGYTKEYADLCSIENIQDGVVHPKTFTKTQDSYRLVNEEFQETYFEKYHALEKDEIRYILMNDAFQTLELPDELDEAETEIVKFPGSTLICGRGGTGKVNRFATIFTLD